MYEYPGEIKWQKDSQNAESMFGFITLKSLRLYEKKGFGLKE